MELSSRAAERKFTEAGKPSCVHTTLASSMPHPVLQTEPHNPACRISTRPDTTPVNPAAVERDDPSRVLIRTDCARTDARDTEQRTNSSRSGRSFTPRDDISRK